MKEKAFNLHVAYYYEDSKEGYLQDAVYEFREGDGSEIETELNEFGKPKITPEILDVIRAELKKKHNADTISIQTWQWFD